MVTLVTARSTYIYATNHACEANSMQYGVEPYEKVVGFRFYLATCSLPTVSFYRTCYSNIQVLSSFELFSGTTKYLLPLPHV